MDKKIDTESSELSSLTDSFGLVQHVPGSTHIKGHNLDLGSFIYDHNTIHFSVKPGKEHSSKKTLTTRKIKSVNPNEFSRDILSPESLTNPPPPHVDDVVCLYNTVLHGLPGKHSPIAPLKTHSVAQRLRQGWITDDILEAKRKRHK